MIKIREKNKGITLIALVITIIILLILAGITIATLGGENGLIAKVKKAKEAEIKAEMREELTLALHDLQIEKRAEATLDDVTQDWINEQIKKYECTVKDDASLSGKQVIMKKDKIIGKFLIDGNLNIVEEEYNESSIEFSYETREREGNKINIAIIIKDEINGIKEVQMPDGTIYPYNKKEQVGIDYSVELGVEYKVKITSESGEVVEKTIKIDDYYYKITKNLGEGIKIDNTAIKTAWNKPYQATITTEEDYIIDTITVTMGGQAVTVDKTTGVINIEKVTDDIEITVTSKKIEIVTTEPIINTTTTATSSAEKNTQFKLKTLYINFSATIEGTKCTISPEVPYAINDNGTYKFTITGKYNEKTITKELEVEVNQYKVASGLVKYDAGDWTKEEIDELKKLKLYDINANHLPSTDGTFKLNDDKGINFTFGGFTYKGDVANQSAIDSGKVITSKNQSVSPQDGIGIPQYNGWNVFATKVEKNNDGTEKIYVTKIIHAGASENFVFYYNYDTDQEKYYGYRAEYLLSSGERYTGYNLLPDGTKINSRIWDMYKDKELDKKGWIKEIHYINQNDINETGVFDERLNIGSTYWLASAGWRGIALNCMTANSGKPEGNSGCRGIRPVVEMVDGVYIASGTGTEADPYILGKD